MTEKVVLTGGFGFIGQAVLSRLLDERLRVLVIDNHSAPVASALKAYAAVESLNRDVATLSPEMLPGFENAAWVHLAADAFIPDTFLHPFDTFQTNVIGTLRVCRVAEALAARRIVVISSGEVYGSAPTTVRMRETSSVQPKSLYAISKLVSENVVRAFDLRDLPWVILRLFNAYGSNATHPYFVPDVIRQCVKESEIRVGNLVSVRDLTYVSDTAEAIFRALSVSGIEGQTINVCSGEPRPMSTVLRRIQELTGAMAKKVVVDAARLRPIGMDPEALVGDNETARRVLDWSPKVAFDDGLERTVRTYSSCDNWPYEDPLQPEPAATQAVP